MKKDAYSWVELHTLSQECKGDVKRVNKYVAGTPQKTQSLTKTGGIRHFF